jgi:dUTP pyrophosphatase
MILKVRRLDEAARLPQYAHPGDAGLDLFASEEFLLEPGAVGLIKTGIAIQLPPQTEGQIRPRSGLALKHGLSVLNSPGTVDEGYRGEVGVIMINHGLAAFKIEQGMKIAQMVVKPSITVTIEDVGELSSSRRGAGGFGSTGT